MNAKEIYHLLDLHLTKCIVANGYKKYKPKQFIYINDEVLMVIRLFFSKADIYIWYASYPMCENDISLGAGAVAGRFPMEENTLNIESFVNFNLSVKQLDKGLEEIFDFQKRRSTVSEIGELIPDNAKPLLLFIKGLCLAAQGDNDGAKVLIESFMKVGLNFGESRSGAEKLLASFQDGTTKQLLNENKIKNIKKLRLQKYINSD